MSTIPAAVRQAIRQINTTPCNFSDEQENWLALPDILRTIIVNISTSTFTVLRATADFDWVDASPDPYVDCTDNDGLGSVRVYLPRIAEGDPNVRAGDQVFYKNYDAGSGVVAWCDSPYLDDKIGTVKFWPLASGTIPPGWAVMDGTANSSGSGIDLTGTFIIGDTVAGTSNPAVPTGSSPPASGQTTTDISNVQVLENPPGLTSTASPINISHNLDTSVWGGLLNVVPAGPLITDLAVTEVTIDPATVDPLYIIEDAEAGTSNPVLVAE
jgi:hypothetical protein